MPTRTDNRTQNTIGANASPRNTVLHDFTYSNKDYYAQYNGADRKKYSTFFYRDKAVRIIEEFDFYDDHPLMLYVAFQAVHDPFIDDEEFANGIPTGYLKESMYTSIHQVG